MERIQKIISEVGYTSRRKAEELIKQGKVLINGETAFLGQRAGDKDIIEVEGIKLQKTTKEYYLLYKPEGYISTTSDEKNRKVVTDLINTKERIYPVGRLDANTSGLLILTNDGELANRLMHPKYHIQKTYLAKINALMSMADVKKLLQGVYLDNHKIIPDKVKVKSKNLKTKTSLVEITVHDGKNHEIKRLINSLGYEVIGLKRISLDFLDLKGLKKGEARRLNPKEVKKLYFITK